jgi:hypothetical protein
MLLRLLLVMCLAEPITEPEVDTYYKAEKSKGEKAEHPTLTFSRMRVGHVGYMPYAYKPSEPKPFATSTIDRIVDDSSFVMKVQTYDIVAELYRGTADTRKDRLGPDKPQAGQVYFLLVTGVNTNGRVDGQSMRLPGGWIVLRTRKVQTSEGEKTVFVIEPFSLPSLK